MATSGDFLTAFAYHSWDSKDSKDSKEKIVIIIDEFDEIYNVSVGIRDSCLSTFRVARNLNHLYAIDSIITCGTFNLLHLTTSNLRVSPFNVDFSIRNPYFTFKDTQTIFGKYAQDEGIEIDERIVQEIFHNSNGHPGMVCLCGKAIHIELRPGIDGSQNNRLDYRTWTEFSTSKLQEHIGSYKTFRRMVDALMTDSAVEAVDLLRRDFLGRLGPRLVSDEDRKEADFLAAEGVLLERNGAYFTASAYIDMFIRRYVIPKKYPQCPSSIIPIEQEDHQDRLDVLATVKEALPFFDKVLISQSHARSYKKSGKAIMVDGVFNKRVPRESVYDGELSRILSSWLGSEGTYNITGQWHLMDVDNHRYADIVIQNNEEPTVVLELLATSGQASLLEHIKRVISYKSLLSEGKPHKAAKAWVIHFTRQDNYLKGPFWPNMEQLWDVNVVHIWHDSAFMDVRMSARWYDGGGVYHAVDNRAVDV
ncbi:hypothetical protein BGX34_011106 [Mortierella sp. NVP85]|nr:hypothetical protein BGX34_011106 [Mortierella sp. NVP85]